MNDTKIDFYAPYRKPNGQLIYGAAAANKRIADAGGFNRFAYELVNTGINIGYNTALESQIRRKR